MACGLAIRDSRSCDCTQPMPFSLKALFPLTCVLGNLPFFLKSILTENSAILIATINTVIRIVFSISINFVVQIYTFVIEFGRFITEKEDESLINSTF